jgi:hypothetical protein
MDSDKKLNRKLNRPRRRSDDNSSTFFLRKVDLKMDTFEQEFCGNDAVKGMLNGKSKLKPLFETQ